MARGIPRPSFLGVPDLFSLLNSPRNRFYHSSDPWFLAKIPRGPRTLKIWSKRPYSCMHLCLYWLENFQNTFQNGVFLQYFLLLAVWDNFFHWNIYVHINVRYILFWFFVILFWKTFNCPCCVAEWNDKPIATHKKVTKSSLIKSFYKWIQYNFIFFTSNLNSKT